MSATLINEKIILKNNKKLLTNSLECDIIQIKKERRQRL